ncbi:AAA family ATPase [Synechococcus sp. C9]|uniref:AAA family ATPase n=1 Tax=Synechococcus sp. C9 TaxID=102119 RepID=UPI001FF1246D|nr:AAA family ATPase [Synechococcus sp. C9]
MDGFGGGGSHDTDTGVSQRFLGTLLTWMQEKTQPVFIVATANDLSPLPPELLRKGRFDEIFFVDLPDEVERERIWQIHLCHRKQDPAQFDLPSLVKASEGFSGAEIEQVVVAGLYRALYIQKPLDTALLLAEIAQTIPLCISRREEISHLRQFARGRFTPVH